MSRTARRVIDVGLILAALLGSAHVVMLMPRWLA